MDMCIICCVELIFHPHTLTHRTGRDCAPPGRGVSECRPEKCRAEALCGDWRVQTSPSSLRLHHSRHAVTVGCSPAGRCTFLSCHCQSLCCWASPAGRLLCLSHRCSAHGRGTSQSARLPRVVLCCHGDGHSVLVLLPRYGARALRRGCHSNHFLPAGHCDSDPTQPSILLLLPHWVLVRGAAPVLNASFRAPLIFFSTLAGSRGTPEDNGGHKLTEDILLPPAQYGEGAPALIS